MSVNNTRFVLAHRAFFTSFAVHNNFRVFKDKSDVEWADVIIFTGGEDIHPRLYNEPVAGAVGINEVRDATEVSVFWLAREMKKRIIGVCRGHQLINSLLGGKLLQNIAPAHETYHTVTYLQPSGIQSLLGDVVNSYHHQGYTVRMMSPELSAVAIAPDGIVEIAKGVRVVTTQFHPEFFNESTYLGILECLLTEA